MYATCAIPGCCEAFNKTRIHHVIAWEDGGPTDIELLVPLCDKHHHAVHEGGCTLRLAPDRSLTITHPDGTTRSTGHPHERGRHERGSRFACHPVGYRLWTGGVPNA
jgi:hypothetical protein